MKILYRITLLGLLILLFRFDTQAQDDKYKETIIGECSRVAGILDEMIYFQTEMEEIKKAKTKGYYSKDDYPYEMLELNYRKYVKNNVTKANFQFFVQSMKAIDNYLAAIDNKFNRQKGEEKTGTNNRVEQQRFQQAKQEAEQTFAKEKAQFDIDCTKETSKKKKKNKN